MKCSACDGDNWMVTCKRKYENNNHCQSSIEGVDCACVCGEEYSDIGKGVLIAEGVAMVAGIKLI
jgi:hypothetical protein